MDTNLTVVSSDDKGAISILDTCYTLEVGATFHTHDEYRYCNEHLHFWEKTARGGDGTRDENENGFSVFVLDRTCFQYYLLFCGRD